MVLKTSSPLPSPSFVKSTTEGRPRRGGIVGRRFAKASVMGRGCSIVQSKRASSPQPSPPSDGREGETPGPGLDAALFAALPP